ncbi:MAG: hypothetical protein V4580_05095 [Bacteroidota bacterium]
MKFRSLSNHSNRLNAIGKIVKMYVFLICFVLGTNVAFSQKGHGNGHGKGNGGHGNGHANGNKGAKVVVKGGAPHGRVVVKSHYRPAKIGVYHPHWHPAHDYHRRWVYFPRHNFYWDNWRQGYYYRNGTVWVFNATPPAVIVNVNLANESSYELREDEDDMDDVYIVNGKHKTVYIVK